MVQNKYLPFYTVYFGSHPGVGEKELCETVSDEITSEETTEEAQLSYQSREEGIMQSYYSRRLQILQGITESVCQEEDYEGSRIYDEYPDKRMLGMLVKKIIARTQQEYPEFCENREKDISELLEDLAQALLLHEIRIRRVKREQCRRH